MKSKHLKQGIAIVLLAALLLTCTGCTVSFPEEKYHQYLLDPVGYVQEELGEGHPLVDFFAGSIGQAFFAYMRRLAIESERKAEEEASKPSTPPPAQPALLYYDTYGMADIFDDYDWGFMDSKSGLEKFFGFFSHAIMNAKDRYKEAFRSYILEFIIENEDRYTLSNIPYEQKENTIFSVVEQIQEAVTPWLNTATGAAQIDLLENIQTACVAMKSYKDSGKAIDGFFEMDFANCMKDLAEYTKLSNYKLQIKIELPETLGGMFSKVGSIAGTIKLGFDIADCVRSVSDVITIQQKAYLFFELREIFTKILANATDQRIKDAAREVWGEMSGGIGTDIGDLIVRNGIHAVININPIVAAVTSGIDFWLANFTRLKELNQAYAADAIRHIKIACCELLKEYTVKVESSFYTDNLHYYKEEDKTEVNVYFMHCLQTHLVWIYVINDKNAQSNVVLEYARMSGIQLPEIAKEYTVD